MKLSHCHRFLLVDSDHFKRDGFVLGYSVAYSNLFQMIAIKIYCMVVVISFNKKFTENHPSFN